MREGEILPLIQRQNVIGHGPCVCQSVTAQILGPNSGHIITSHERWHQPKFSHTLLIIISRQMSVHLERPHRRGLSLENSFHELFSRVL